MSAILSHAVRRYVSTSLARRAGQRVEGPSAVSGGHEGGYKVWRNLTFIVAFPSIILCAVNCVLAHQHEHGRPEFVKYDYRCVRTKRFPWGDGNHSLFHNPHANALPDGYEDAH